MSTLTAVIGVLTLIALGVAVIVVADEILHRRRRKPRWTDLIGIDPDFTNGACTVDYLSWSHSEPRRDFLHDGCWLRLSGVGDLTEQERLISWAGLMELLDEHWPADIFPTLEDDPQRDASARIVSLLRWVDKGKARTKDDDTAIKRLSWQVCQIAIQRDEARAALARVEAVCASAIRVRTERMVEGSIVHIAAKDAIDTFAEAIRDAMLDAAAPFHAQHGQKVNISPLGLYRDNPDNRPRMGEDANQFLARMFEQSKRAPITYTNPDSSEFGAKAAIQRFIARSRFRR